MAVIKDRCYDSYRIDDEGQASINNEDFYDKKHMAIINNYLNTTLKRIKKCPYCRSTLYISIHEKLLYSDVHEVYAKLAICPNCGFWQLYHYKNCEDSRPSSQEWCAAISYLKEFNTDINKECLSDISQNIRRNPMLWHNIEPKTMEKLVCEIFSNYYNNSEAMHVGKSHDKGVDIIFFDNRRNKYLIQVKRRRNPESFESAETVTKLLGALVQDGTTLRGIAVSTADHFSYWAYRAKGDARNNYGFIVDLVDRHLLNRMISPSIPRANYFDYLLRENIHELLIPFNKQKVERGIKSILFQRKLTNFTTKQCVER